MKSTLKIISFLIIAFAIAGCSKSWENKKNNSSLSGMGGTFSLPFYGIAFENYYMQTGIRINESGTGSSSGLRALQDKTIDFAYSEGIPSEKELAEFKEELLFIPTCLGGLVIAFNLPGIDELNLSGTTIADIFMNKIKYWDHETIRKENPSKKLPHKSITIVFRSDGSGSSYVLSDYLCKVSPEWNKEVGRRKTFNWGQGVTVKNCMKAASAISKIEGAIGYTSAEHADMLDLPSVAIKNTEGKYIAFSKESVYAAANTDNIEFPVMITNSPNENAYPLSCYSWILVYKNQAYDKRSVEKYNSLKHFLKFLILAETQEIAGKLNYTPIPENISQKALEQIKQLEWKEPN